MRMVLWVSACALALGVGTAGAAPVSDVVTIGAGKIQGAVDDGVLSFKGVPFAQPPVGELRWRAPQPAKPWTGVRPATAYGADCMQQPFPSDAAPLGTKPAEDCLVANVWRPAGAAAKKLPIMVWIYGGGFVNGGSSPSVYDGSQFARRGVVFVSFNYRLGRFGFFGHPALTAANADGGRLGNYGYMDQIAALKWVKENAAAFGGDPDNVTVFGESAGGGSTHMLLTSPESKGLFQKAAIMSGGGRGSLMGPRRLSQDLPGVPSAETIGVNFAKSVGIEGTGPEALAALRALPAEKVLAGLNMAAMFNPNGPPTYGGPMMDGKIVVADPEAAYRAGTQVKGPVMVGATSADIGFGFAQTKDQVFDPFGPLKDAAKAAYDPAGDADVRLVAYKVAMDKMMVESARFVAKVISAQGVPAYEYRFSYVADSMKGEWKMGAPHATDIPYVFDTVKAKYGAALTAKDAAIAKAANAYFANFAKTGDPNGPGLAKWPAYDAKADVLMDFGADGVATAKSEPWKARMDVTEAAAKPSTATAGR
ncbi:MULTISPECIES: carboxylesterase/lipase family protein [unclassified Caulobacter]|uniref:carboxylesterase/lipase family protein n=1 Tax=unclassified Caulobacter TaxID=2648921 RepID=UPI0006F594FA|nr:MULTISPECIES: carboxylesterase family protein [unclassified Caulobacter]KQV57336.1 carboxylesterase [Caulobacter sp. Root342]KQV66908.1 carboxylesterase [Caulobacter sp. Root343]